MEPQIAFVTGAASGMGRIIALRMAERGCQVALVDRNSDLLENTCSKSPNLHPYACDVTDPQAITTAADGVARELGPIDRLVHCAAIMPAGRLVDQPAEVIRHLMEVNYGGTVNVVKAVLPAMLTRDCGEIVIFGSTGGSIFVPECGAYCASKAATNAFAEILIEETRGSGVHVMLVCPPLVDTPLLQQAVETSNPATVRYSIENKRFADPEFIIDEVEKGILKKTKILLPGTEAKLLMRARRFTPRLLRKVIQFADRQ